MSKNKNKSKKENVSNWQIAQIQQGLKEAQEGKFVTSPIKRNLLKKNKKTTRSED